MLNNIFSHLLNQHHVSEHTIKILWDEVAEKHKEPHRHYHNFSHLGHLLSLLNEVEKLTESPQALYLAVFYHDIIYDPKARDNEEQSAHLAKERLKDIKLPTTFIQKCTSTILATKSHLLHEDKDINYFTDADLGILGSEWPEYVTYSQKIRKEYSCYPDKTYVEGRKKVLVHFLNMPRIYKTDYFFNKFEKRCRINLSKELNNL